VISGKRKAGSHIHHTSFCELQGKFSSSHHRIWETYSIAETSIFTYSLAAALSLIWSGKLKQNEDNQEIDIFR